MRRFTLLLAASLLALSGCTSDSDSKDGPDDSQTTSTGSDEQGSDGPDDATPEPKGPSCDDVWQVGEDLPKDYTVCAAGSEQGTQDVTKCEDGRKLIVFDDALYAVTGGPIQESSAAPVQDTPEFGKVFTSCTGE